MNSTTLAQPQDFKYWRGVNLSAINKIGDDYDNTIQSRNKDAVTDNASQSMDLEEMQKPQSFGLVKMEQTLSPNNSSSSKVLPEEDEDEPHPIPTKLQARLILPSKQICKRRQRQEDVELTLVYGDEGEESVIMIELERLMCIVRLITPTLPQQPEPHPVGNRGRKRKRRDSLTPHPEEESGTGGQDSENMEEEDSISRISPPSPASFSDTFFSDSFSSSGNDSQEDSLQELTSGRKLRSRTLSWPRITKIVGNNPARIGEDLVSPNKQAKKIDENTREKPFTCSQCNKMFTSISTLTRHQRLHERDPKKRRPFQCHMCKQPFTRKNSLALHVKTVHLRLKKFTCPRCGQKFSYKRGMDRHIRAVHLRLTKHKCPSCDKEFAQKGNLNIHVSSVHLGICHPCPQPRTTPQENSLQRVK